MFSDLHTEGAITNHLVLPRLAIASYQDDLVEVVYSSHEEVADLTADGHLLAYHELQRHVQDEPDASVTYVRDGRTHRLGEAGAQTAQFELSALERKLLHFRPVHSDGSPDC